MRVTEVRAILKPLLFLSKREVGVALTLQDICCNSLSLAQYQAATEGCIPTRAVPGVGPGIPLVSHSEILIIPSSQRDAAKPLPSPRSALPWTCQFDHPCSHKGSGRKSTVQSLARNTSALV